MSTNHIVIEFILENYFSLMKAATFQLLASCHVRYKQSSHFPWLDDFPSSLILSLLVGAPQKEATMGKTNRMPELFKRNHTWWIDKQINGQRVQESTGTSDPKEAKRYLIHKLETLRQTKVYGVLKLRRWA
jgi:hypothetical protein